MSVIIDASWTWQANRWISFKLFRDCLKFTTGDSELEKDIAFLEKASIDLLDLTDFPNNSPELFSSLVDKVIKYNGTTQGEDMVDRSYFEMYFNKLLELKEMPDSHKTKFIE